METTQIMFCFDGGKWLCDFIEVAEGQTTKEVIDAYMKQYMEIRDSMKIVSMLLPGIVQISVMGESNVVATT